MSKIIILHYENFIITNKQVKCLVGVGQTSHTTHDTKDIVIGSIDTDLGGLGTLNSGVGKNKLKGGVVNSGEVARSGRLVFLRAKSERVNIDSGIRVSGVVLVRLNKVEVGSLTLRESVLSVKL